MKTILNNNSANSAINSDISSIGKTNNYYNEPISYQGDKAIVSSGKLSDILERKKISKVINTLYIEEFEGDIDNVIEMLNEVKKSNIDEYNSIKLREEIEYDDDGKFSQLSFVGYRLENDKEYNIRMEDHARQELNKILREKANAEAEKKKYLELKEKYGDTN